jgi:hypothetical protein
MTGTAVELDTVYGKLYSTGDTFTIRQTGEIRVDGSVNFYAEQDVFGVPKPLPMEMGDFEYDPLTADATTVFNTDTTTKPISVKPVIFIDPAKCAYAYTDANTVNEVVTGVTPIVGFDDTTVDPLTYVGLLHTIPAGIPANSSIDSAVMVFVFARTSVGTGTGTWTGTGTGTGTAGFYTARTVRIYGIEDDISITASLVDYDDLAVDPVLTTQYVDAILDEEGSAVIDLTSIIQELVDDVTGWTSDSPVQLQLSDIGDVPVTGKNETIIFSHQGRTTALVVRYS